jgi:hypothetical protein
MKRGMLMLLLALPGLLPAMSARAAVDTAAWDGLLRQHVVAVRDGHATEVDYAGFMADRGRLQQYLAEAFVAAQPLRGRALPGVEYFQMVPGRFRGGLARGEESP